MDRRLHTFASARGSVVTSAQAGALDVDESALRRLRRAGELVRVRRDAYVLGEAWAAATPEQRLALRTRAILATRGADVASHQAALAMQGLPLYGVDLVTVDVLTRTRRVRLAAGLRTHPSRPGGEHVVADGYRCVPVAVAIAQVTMRDGLMAGLVPLDAALHRHRCSPGEVRSALDERATTARLRARRDALLRLADGASESVGETLTRLALVDAGLPVRSQVEVRDPAGRFVGRVDLLVGDRVVVEFDGAVKYAGAEGREALVREKRREDALRALGYLVVRVTWADLERPGAVVALVRRALTGLSATDGRLSAS
ncbi:type IV toxin-antitoxin system AbiEi family antitoxin domain-containing protein [uncultured Phycicoccus sp.]|uniref:type IV toxin-antitoxin system AbiEi family antitoxin domain-containing protein n=1 Tax=uncultured Phycicoccus sp. TaxID=661422 RepID=UPI00260CB3D7|nr:type IV toxin-antitoxin system AbiEi family antitoxin domain-containing protein [uncultured Phycicoccus sp.]